MSDTPDIPDFLRAEVTAALPSPAGYEGVKARRPRREKRQRFDLPRNMEPASWDLLREIEKHKAEKKAEHFRLLRERHGR